MIPTTAQGEPGWAASASCHLLLGCIEMSEKTKGATRRQLREFLSDTTAAAVQPLESTSWHQAGASQRQASKYQPTYRTPAEWAFFNAAVLHLIPAEGEGPDGVRAGVSDFIDRQSEIPHGHFRRCLP
jgi:gluconate 2-dehydrogenase gamma chain